MLDLLEASRKMDVMELSNRQKGDKGERGEAGIVGPSGLVSGGATYTQWEDIVS